MGTTYKTVDLCAGIGGIRRGFERTGFFSNVLSSEIDKYACKTYEFLFGENPNNDLTKESFKKIIEQTTYDVLMAGFPCQPFSRAGLNEGFDDREKGSIFFHIVEIVKRTQPSAVFLENVDHLVTHEKGNTFKKILRTLEISLDYKVIGVRKDDKKDIVYISNDFIRNSKYFGVPQNRPRTYIIAFNRKLFGNNLNKIENAELPKDRPEVLYKNINHVLEKNVDPHYYLGSGYLETLKRHRKREVKKGNNFGFKIINESGNENPIANTLLASGGSGRERNLIYDPQNGIAGKVLKSKKTPLNKEGIRIMTPTEWGRLQGFVGYAFLENNKDKFGFPKDIPELHRYRQLGNSVTIPVIETMALFILDCFKMMDYKPLKSKQQVK